LETLKKCSLTSEKGDLIAGAYARVGRIASPPRQMRSVMKHVGFLSSVTTELNLPDAEYLDRLHKKLQKMR
jgi:hypothetical protein